MVFDIRQFKTVQTNTVTDIRFDVVPFVNCAIFEAVFKQYLMCALWHFQVFPCTLSSVVTICNINKHIAHILRSQVIQTFVHHGCLSEFNLENRRCDLFSGSLIALPLHLKLCELPVFELSKCYKHEVSPPKQSIYGKISEFEKSLRVANSKQPFILLKSSSFLLILLTTP